MPTATLRSSGPSYASKLHVALAGQEEVTLEGVVSSGKVESEDSIPATPEEPDEVKLLRRAKGVYGTA